MTTLRAELEQSRDRHWLSCFVFAVLAVPCLAVSVAVPGLVVKTVTVGLTLGCALASFVAGKAATQLESILTSGASARHPAGRETAEQ